MNLRNLVLLPLLVLAGLIPWVDPGQPGGLRAAGPPKVFDPAPSDQEIQDVVYLGLPRPLLIRLRIRLGGQPFRAAWDDYVGRVFRYLDVNGDGVLSGDELDRIPLANDRDVRIFLADVSGVLGKPVKQARTERWSRKELAAYYIGRGFQPFQLGGNGGAVAEYYSAVRLWEVGESSPSAEAVSKRLFELLDTNKDGKLSREELAAAPLLLRKLDTNEDETLSKREIMGQTDAGMNGVGDVINLTFAIDGSVSRGGDSPFTPVTAGKTDPDLAQKLLARYGGGRKKLTREALPLDKATFDQLDVDGNGVLDSEELARFTARTPDLELRVRLGEGGNRPAVELVQQPGKPLPEGVRVSVQPHPGAVGNGNRNLVAVEGTATLVTVTRVAVGNGNGKRLAAEVPRGLVLEMGNTRIELAGPAQQTWNSGWSYAVGSREQYIAQFKQADRDKNGYLDEKEAQAHPAFRGLFKLMDRDGDGKVFENEMLAYFEQVDGFRTGAAAASAALHFSDKARGLFELADTDGDGRLSLRELRNMVKLLEKLDTNGDGVLTWDELPRHYRAEFGPGSGGGSDWDGRVLLASSFRVYQNGSMALPVRTAGPLWFRKMDRNQDGDVSRREFLGTDEEFRRIDTDGDGLISAEEATRADAWYRERKKKKE
jgi:Ca2+-binding EF-hand superfamily protein